MSTTAPSLIISNISNHLDTYFPLLRFGEQWPYTDFGIEICWNLFRVDLAFRNTSVKLLLSVEQCWYTSQVPMYVMYYWTNREDTETTTSIREITQYYPLDNPRPQPSPPVVTGVFEIWVEDNLSVDWTGVVVKSFILILLRQGVTHKYPVKYGRKYCRAHGISSWAMKIIFDYFAA